MHIICPHCATKFALTEPTAAKLMQQAEQKLKSEYEQKLIAEKEHAALSAQKTAERTKLQIRTLEEQLEQIRASLSEALSRAASGNNQQKGEALELALEEELQEAFPTDKINEVKKGASGADISHSVIDAAFNACGTILYECKNAKWRISWIEKLKNDTRVAKADIGILVALDFPAEWGDFHQIEGTIWIVKPRLAVNFASALRHMLIALATAGRNNAFKDERIQFIHNYLTGSEFKSRLEPLIEGYDTLQRELEKERRAAQMRWSHQEQTIRMMIDNTYGLYGDFQGMLTPTKKQLPLLKKKNENTPQNIDELFDNVEFNTA